MSILGRMSQQCSLRWDTWLFHRHRTDYYQYLGDLLRDQQGARTLRDVFVRDMQRYGFSTVRGRLARHWHERYRSSGGDLYATWSDTLPSSDLAVIRSAQIQGNDAVIATLHELASALRLMAQLRGLVSSILAVAVCAVVLMILMMVAIPFFTLPRLLQAFEVLPPDYYGMLTRRLIVLADVVRHGILPLSLFLIAMCVWVVWSIPNWTGSARQLLDQWGIWRIYRYVQGMRFLVFLSILLRKDTQGPVHLRTALMLMQPGCPPWLSWHIDQMRNALDQGAGGIDVFDTGLLESEAFWFMQDMVAARGLRQGLGLACERMRSHVLGRVRLQASAVRWTIMVLCVVMVLGLALWHYAVIDELRRALMIFYSSR